MHRFLAILWDSSNLEHTREFQSLKLNRTSRPAQWRIACEWPGVFAMHTGLRRGVAEAYPLPNGSGVLLGRIFAKRHEDYATLPQLTFDARETHEILRSSGQHLVDRYWGAYFAILHDESAGKCHVFRDPTGNIPAYHAQLNGLNIFFSHVEDCTKLLNMAFKVNRQHIIRWLVSFSQTHRDTGLEGVASVPAGERLTISHGLVTRSCLWDPIAIADVALGGQTMDEAATALRSTLQHTVDAWASCYQSITHKLSGGLDSSIVAGCLAQAPSKPNVSYLHFSIDRDVGRERLLLPGVDPRIAAKVRTITGPGDERYFARLVAERWQTAMVERQRSPELDLRRLWHTSLKVSPAMYYTNLEMDDAELEMVKLSGAEAFFSGQAGDSVFLATLQPLPAIDFAFHHGLGSGLWHQLVMSAKLSKESLWSVLGKAIRYGALRRPYPLACYALTSPTLVREEHTATLSSSDFDSDLAKRVACSALPPGKRNHASGVTWSAYYDFVFDSGKHADHIDPLNSQPVWEVMLSIPTATLLTGGVSRGLARRAFADLLPAEIRKRQVKGTGSPFYQRLVRQNKDFLHAKLVDGLLVKHGYLDRQRLHECLTAAEPSMTIYPTTILNYLSAEIWLQQWTGHQLNSGTQGPARLQNATR